MEGVSGAQRFYERESGFLPWFSNASSFLSLCSVENPSKSSRTSEPHPRQKKMKVPQDVDMEDLGDES